MKWVVCYFSGTGNTRRIAELWDEALKANHEESELWSMERGLPPSAYDRLVLLWPVYAFNAPWFVLDWAEKLPPHHVPVTVVSVSGEPLRLNMASSCTLERILKQKGYTFNGRYNYVMPYCIMFRYSDERVWRLWQAAQALVPLDAAEVLAGKGRTYTPSLWQKLVHRVMKIEFWGGRFNGRFYSVDKHTCVSCKQCLARCPVHNITWGSDDRPKFGKRCLMCQRCAMYCPTDAISIGLFSRWKVHGPYSFTKPAGTQKQKHAWYCRNAFVHYFREASRRSGKEI